MTDRWEYMSLTWSYTATEVSRDPYKFEWGTHLVIWRPGATEAEEIQLWSSSDSSVSGPSELNVLNEFGAEGWELVCREVLDSVMMKTVGGWPEGGRPVRTRATLKRRLQA